MPASLHLSARQRSLKAQLGPLVWAARVRDARVRARVVRAFERLRARGIPREAAAARAGTQQKAAAVERWRAALARQGLAGLIASTGRTRTKGHLDPVLGPRRRTHRTRSALSFVKWAGSKQGVLEALLARLPKRVGTYYEPMVGSGALFLALKPKRAVLGDANAELMECYLQLRDHLEEVLAALARHRNTSAHFHRVRGQDVRRLSPAARAARFIYLNKTCFNGLYRVNASGRFNVPYGRIAYARLCDEPVLRRVSAALADVELHSGDFRQTCRKAKRGDLVYFDPPYLTETRVRALRYRTTVFDLAEHERLAASVRELAARGCLVMVSNADLPAVRKLYRGFTVERLRLSRPINATAQGRAGFSELLIHNLTGAGRGALAAQAAVREARRLPEGDRPLSRAPAQRRGAGPRKQLQLHFADLAVN